MMGRGLIGCFIDALWDSVCERKEVISFLEEEASLCVFLTVLRVEMVSVVETVDLILWLASGSF